MATYTWPTTTAMKPSGFKMYPRHNVMRSTSQLNAFTQTSSLPGARWMVSIDMPDQTKADRAQLEAFYNRLAGGEHRAALWDMRKTRPLGNIALSGVTASAAAQFATSVTLNGCFGRNLLRSTQDCSNTTYWGRPSATVTANTDVAPDGTTTADTVSVPNGTTGGVFQNATVVPGRTYWFSFYAKRGSQTAAEYRFYDNTNSANVGGGSYYSQINSSTYTRVAFQFTAPAGCTSMRCYCIADYSGGATPLGAIVWGFQLDEFRLTDYSLATLLAGDRIGLTISTGSASQLVEVSADSTANDAGVITVPIHTKLRGSVSNGSAVVLDKPTALFIPTTPDGIPWDGRPGGIAPGISFDLMEVFS